MEGASAGPKCHAPTWRWRAQSGTVRMVESSSLGRRVSDMDLGMMVQPFVISWAFAKVWPKESATQEPDLVGRHELASCCFVQYSISTNKALLLHFPLYLVSFPFSFCWFCASTLIRPAKPTSQTRFACNVPTGTGIGSKTKAVVLVSQQWLRRSWADNGFSRGPDSPHETARENTE